MIKTNITNEYPTHIAKCKDSTLHLFIVDYTNQTGSLRGVEVFEEVPPGNINYFSLINSNAQNNSYITFDNTSFVDAVNRPRTQCECVVFPESSTADSWIFFLETKYSNVVKNNRANLKEALRQLIKTRSYYYSRSIFTATNKCYLIASLPMQSEPFPNFPFNSSYLRRIKKKYNILIRFKNSAEVQDDKILNV